MLVDTNKTGTKKIWNDGAKTWKKKHEGEGQQFIVTKEN